MHMEKCFVTGKKITDIKLCWYSYEFDAFVLNEALSVIRERVWEGDKEAKILMEECRARFTEDLYD